jgi:hypothetical protein
VERAVQAGSSGAAGTPAAKLLAAGMPLVHYPANDRFEDWAQGPRPWQGLQSRAARGLAPPEDPFGDLRGRHVFFYAGPPCYFRTNCSGNAVLYFDPRTEDGKGGGALPFDSGSLEDRPPKLQPWRSRGAAPDECWELVERHRRALRGWRDHFEHWLAYSYDDPGRYLETRPDRYAAGQPDRLDPPEILEHNGEKGRALYGGDCADRRAWTWEIHIEGEVSWAAVRAVHVPPRLLAKAAKWARDVKGVHGTLPEVKSLRYNVGASGPMYDAFFEDAGRVLREVIGT